MKMILKRFSCLLLLITTVAIGQPKEIGKLKKYVVELHPSLAVEQLNDSIQCQRTEIDSVSIVYYFLHDTCQCVAFVFYKFENFGYVYSGFLKNYKKISNDGFYINDEVNVYVEFPKIPIVYYVYQRKKYKKTNN